MGETITKIRGLSLSFKTTPLFHMWDVLFFQTWIVLHFLITLIEEIKFLFFSLPLIIGREKKEKKEV